ncbi:hypothetical protein GDO78_013753 [Eleutherodactylus coqui]|uniref:Ig-like domain-containing protein n=1 Tax=Eleutherodactylus coqui TaxID=57060 RepID=A0A8J6EBL9_ELECQ|nr:hypothetical protein GDO78_013753 [Eleutherodactylus coqui]
MMRAVRTTSVVFTLLLAGVLGQYLVHQDPHITVTEGDDVQINCNYTGTEYSLQWYHRVSNRKIQAILLLSANGHTSHGRFTMFLNTKQRFTYLYINRTQVEDSAVYYCAMEALC